MKRFEYIIAYYSIAAATIFAATNQPFHSFESLVQHLQSSHDSHQSVHVPGLERLLSSQELGRCRELQSQLFFYRGLAKFDPSYIQKVRELEAQTSGCPLPSKESHAKP